MDDRIGVFWRQEEFFVSEGLVRVVGTKMATATDMATATEAPCSSTNATQTWLYGFRVLGHDGPSSPASFTGLHVDVDKSNHQKNQSARFCK